MQFQGNVKDLVKIMLKGSPEDKTNIAPIFLHEIRKQANQCLELAKNTQSDFTNLTELLEEVSLAATSAKGLHEKQLSETVQQTIGRLTNHVGVTAILVKGVADLASSHSGEGNQKEDDTKALTAALKYVSELYILNKYLQEKIAAQSSQESTEDASTKIERNWSGQMIALHPERDEEELNFRRKELNENCVIAQQRICELAAERREMALKHVHEQFEKIKLLESKMPAVAEERKKKISDDVAKSVAMMCIDDVDENDYI
ncbi:unnamed protein product [Mytilus edulis]|uniref:Uncharacterized protein n=1 Tax=Mytilus edulis TaxID=6550 RepID=A0A8S3U9U4_MYTED|nr:unnamed protein product [Mytilus edulis]